MFVRAAAAAAARFLFLHQAIRLDFKDSCILFWHKAEADYNICTIYNSETGVKFYAKVWYNDQGEAEYLKYDEKMTCKAASVTQSIAGS